MVEYEAKNSYNPLLSEFQFLFLRKLEFDLIAQIQHLCDNKAAKGSKIRIMPDVHPGKFATIGTTMYKLLLPNACFQNESLNINLLLHPDLFQ